MAAEVTRFKGVPNLTKAKLTTACILGDTEIISIIALIFLGVAVLYSIHKDYDVEIEGEKGLDGPKGRIKLKRA